MIVISNASPLVALSRIYRLDLFQQLFDTLFIPPAVETEVVTYCPDARQKRHLEAALDTFIVTRAPQHHQLFSRQIGAGERGVLNLAIDLTPDIVLLDDRKARNEARELGLLPTFTSDVLKEAEIQGLIPSYREVFQTLHAHHVHLPES